MDEIYVRPYECWVPLLKAHTSETEDGDRFVNGPVASEEEDYDEEVLDKAGVEDGMDTFFRLGANVDWEHLFKSTKDPSVFVGRGVGKPKINGRLHLVTKLFKGAEFPLAEKVWSLLKAGGGLGYSIEGIATLRDRKNPKHVLKCLVHRVTIASAAKGLGRTMIEVGQPSSMQSIVKSVLSEAENDCLDTWQCMDYSSPIVKALVSGEGVVEGGDTGGAALRGQELRGAKGKKTKVGPKVSPIESIIDKALADLGISNHDAALRAALHQIGVRNGR